jgi:hypothetical protein
MAAATGRFFTGRRHSQMMMAAPAAKIVTIRWLITVAARKAAGTARLRRSSRARASEPRKHSAKQIEMVKENSPARVERMFPPQML